MTRIHTLDQGGSTAAEAAVEAAKLVKKSKSGKSILDRLIDFASSVEDFRRTEKGNIRHRLSDIIVLQILGRISRCVHRADFVAFGRHNLGRFRSMGMLANGVPSEATLFRVENGVKEAGMADRMQEFAEACRDELLGPGPGREIICIDGKAERGTVLENGRNPDIVSAYSWDTGITLATEACEEKSNEIKAVPRLLDKIDIAGKIVTADAMSMQKDIVDQILRKGGDYLIQLKANQRSLRYIVEDNVRKATPLHTYTYGPELGHGRIETRTYRIYDGRDIVVDQDRWGAELTVVECDSDVTEKSTGVRTFEKRYYVTSLPPDTPMLGDIVRRHWSIESMHWMLDRNQRQDDIKRKSARSARNLDTIQRIVQSVFPIWRGMRKKMSDKKKGMAELMRDVSMGFTKLKRFLSQK